MERLRRDRDSERKETNLSEANCLSCELSIKEEAMQIYFLVIRQIWAAKIICDKG